MFNGKKKPNTAEVIAGPAPVTPATTQTMPEVPWSQRLERLREMAKVLNAKRAAAEYEETKKHVEGRIYHLRLRIKEVSANRTQLVAGGEDADAQIRQLGAEIAALEQELAQAKQTALDAFEKDVREFIAESEAIGKMIYAEFYGGQEQVGAIRPELEEMVARLESISLSFGLEKVRPFDHVVGEFNVTAKKVAAQIDRGGSSPEARKTGGSIRHWGDTWPTQIKEVCAALRQLIRK